MRCPVTLCLLILGAAPAVAQDDEAERQARARTATQEQEAAQNRRARLIEEEDEDAQSREELFREYLAPEYRRYLDSRGRIGDRTKLSGSLKTESLYDDNVLLDSANQDADLITTVTPELHLQFEQTRLTASAKYRGPYRLFADHDEFDGMEHFAEGHVRYVSECVWMQAWDSYERVREPYDAVVFRNRVKRQQNDAGATLGAVFNRAEAELSASLRRFDVLEDAFDFFDNRRLDVSFLAGWRLLQQASLIAKAGRGRITYDDSSPFNDFDITWLVAGIRGTVTATLLVEFEAGPFRTDVRGGESTDLPRDDEADVMVRGRIIWHQTQSRIFTLEVERIPIETLTQGWALYTRVRLGVDQWLAERVQVGLTFYYEQSEDPESGDSGRSVGAIGSAECELGRNFVLDAHVEARRLDGAGDATTNVRCGLGIAIVW